MSVKITCDCGSGQFLETFEYHAWRESYGAVHYTPKKLFTCFGCKKIWCELDLFNQQQNLVSGGGGPHCGRAGHLISDDVRPA